jgi:outer membrane immunogenic protein
MKTRLLAAAMTLAAVPAFAADIPRRAAPQQSFVPPPMFTWTGFYVGANAGAIWGDFTKAAGGIGGKTGFTAGGTLGYNHQIGQVVLGVEGDYNYSGLTGTGTLFPTQTPVKAELTSFGTARARLGVAFDRAMIYATGGYAFAFTDINAGFAKQSSTHHGYAIGGGLEYAFTQNVSAKAEYLYMPFDSKNVGALPAFGFGSKAGLDASVVRGGVNYRF